MAVHIRLRRLGKNPKGMAYFRVSVFDKGKGRDSRCLEELGSYNCLTGASNLKRERLEYWVKNGAVMSDTVKSLYKKQKKEA